MKYEIGHHSLQGARSSNQDRVAYAERDNAVFMVVADGLGGHAGGSIAAEIMTKWSIQAFQSIKQSIITQPTAFLALTILQAHNQIVNYAKNKHPDMQPRTTCVLCLLQNGYAYWAHVGDSRLYHFRNESVIARTLDHSTIEQMREKGLIKEEDMRTHPQKSHITRCVGGTHKPEISLSKETRLERGDRLLLCSDGVWEALEDDALAAYMKHEPLDEGIENMLHSAEDKMQQVCDNITAIGLNWHDKRTTSKPLQSLNVANVSQKSLWEKAKKKTVRPKKNAPKNQPARAKSNRDPSSPLRREDVQQEIENLEQYLAQLQPDSDDL